VTGLWNISRIIQSGPRPHFTMEHEEYDVYFDIKKVCRKSFSLIVAIAIDTYLEIVLQQGEKNSYPLNNYTKLCILRKNRPIYVFYWEKLEKEVKNYTC
jgi:hypothetical protein